MCVDMYDTRYCTDATSMVLAAGRGSCSLEQVARSNLNPFGHLTHFWSRGFPLARWSLAKFRYLISQSQLAIFSILKRQNCCTLRARSKYAIKNDSFSDQSLRIISPTRFLPRCAITRCAWAGGTIEFFVACVTQDLSYNWWCNWIRG